MSKIIDAIDGFCAYVFTLIGVLAAQYLPAFRSGDTINLAISWQRIALGAIVAMVVIGSQERIVGEDKTMAKAGRRKRFGYRMVNALAQGLAWSQIMGAVM